MPPTYSGRSLPTAATPLPDCAASTHSIRSLSGYGWPYLAERGKYVAASAPAIPSGTPIEAGDRHPDVVLIRQRLGAASRAEGDANLLDRGLMRRICEVLGEEYSRTSRVDDEVRSALNEVKPVDRAPNRALLDKYLVNLERWRTLPDDLGQLYIWNNLPEFTTRVVKEGAAIHEERIIIGKPDTQTPVFADSMNHIIFQPEWGVPESIKIRQLLPYLRGGDYGVLARRGMQIRDGNRVINPARIKWSKSTFVTFRSSRGRAPAIRSGG